MRLTNSIRSFFVVLCSIPSMVYSQCTHGSNPETIKAAILASCGDDALCIQHHVTELIQNEDCFCQQIGFLIDLHQGYGMVDHEQVEPLQCSRRYFLYWFVRGIHAYENNDFERAIDFFWEVLEAGEMKSSCLTNIGAAYYQIEQRYFALNCFIEAWENEVLDPQNAFMVLNNMAGILVQIRRWNDAKPWIEESKRIIAAQDPAYNPNRLTISNEASASVEANEWIVHLNLEDTEFIKSNWQNIQWGSIYLPASNWTYIILKTAEILDEPEFYASQSRLLKQMVAELSEKEAVSHDLEVYDAVIQAAMNDELSLQQFAQFWEWSTSTTMQASPIHAATEATKADDFHSYVLRVLLWVGWLIGSCLLLGKLLLMRKRKQREHINISNSAEALESIRAWHGGYGSTVEQVTDSIQFLKRHTQKGLSGWLRLQSIDLSEAEFKVLQLTMANKTPKEIALSEHWTPSYVYKIRSQLRDQLNVPKSEELDSWILGQLKP